MQTLEKFLASSEVSLRCREVTLGGHEKLVVFEPWARKQYLCELRGTNGDQPIKAVLGSDNGPPDIVEVLDAVAAEAAVTEEAGGFEQWAVQMGYDPDSRRAERIYRAARRHARLLRGLLGEDDYRGLLWETERL